MFVKYCGFTRPPDVEAALECGIDAVGFIFYRGSRRYVTPEQAAPMARIAGKKGLFRVGVFVDADADEILSIAKTAGLDCLQVYDHGLVSELERYYRVIMVHRIGTEADMQSISAPSGNGLLLFDTYAGDARGGTGTAFNWEVLKGFPFLDRTIVAGGIHEHNVTWLVKNIRPFGVDVASGIEDSPGCKSVIKMRAIMNNIREAL